MEGQTSSKGLGVSQKANIRDSYFHMGDAINAGPSRANALVPTSHRPPAPTSPSSKPAGRAANDQRTVQTSQNPTKRGLPSAGQARAAKFLKTAPPTDKRHAAKDPRAEGQGTSDAAKVTAGSPWNRYKKVIEAKVDGFVVIAERRDDESYDLVRVLSVPEGEEASAKTKKLHEIRHENFLTLLESFSFEGSRHIILEHVSYSLAHVVSSAAYPSVDHLAAIFGQVSCKHGAQDKMLMRADRGRPLLSRVPWHGARIPELLQRAAHAGRRDKNLSVIRIRITPLLRKE